jgi:hypothetical protein
MFENLSKGHIWFTGFILGFIIGLLWTMSVYSTISKDEIYSTEIKELKEQISDDSLTIELLKEEYQILWKDNEILFSMLSKIDDESNGHELLKDLWEKQNQ